MSNTIHIKNPRPGSTKYTSMKRAEQYVRQGVASIRDGELVFYEDSRILQMRKDAVEEIAINRDRGADWVYGWNGNDTRPFVRHTPGQKRS